MISAIVFPPVPWPVPLFSGFFAALVLTPVVRSLAFRVGNVDRPSDRKIHKTPTPLMGGVAVYLAFVIAALTILPLIRPVIGLLVGGFVAIVVGVIDEHLDLKPLVHLGGQILAAVVAIVAGVGVVKSISVPTAALTTPGLRLPLVVGAALTLLWLVGMMNTINLLDGLDGLAAGVCAITAIFLAAWASESSIFFLPATPHHEDLYLPLALAGALMGFLPYNWHQAKIFLGDSGSMFLGLSLGALSIIGPAKLATALLVLMIPVLDVVWAIIRRSMRGRSFLTGDVQHVHHRLLEMGLSYTATVLLFYGLCMALAVVDLFLFKLDKLIAFGLLAVVLGSSFIILEARSSRFATGGAMGRIPANKSKDRDGVHVAGDHVGHPVLPEVDDGEKDESDPEGEESNNSLAGHA